MFYNTCYENFEILSIIEFSYIYINFESLYSTINLNVVMSSFIFFLYIDDTHFLNQ